MEWFICQGYRVWLPIGHSPNVDLIAEDHDANLLRAHEKTTTRLERRRRQVALCTRGTNQSWSGLVKRFTASRCDWLFVLVGDGRRWFISAREVEGDTRVCLGGPKYTHFEVDRGRSLPSGD